MSAPERFDFTLKIIVLGDHNVGKSSMLAQLAERGVASDSGSRCINYQPNSHTEMEVWRSGKRILAKIVDTGGQERFRSITASFYRGAQGCLLMFDAERPDTFTSIHNWHDDLDKYANKQPISTFLVGMNTQSKNRKITTEQAERLATSLGIQFQEVTPSPNMKSSNNLIHIIEALLDRIIIHASRLPSITIDIIPNQDREYLQKLMNQEKIDEKPKRFQCGC